MKFKTIALITFSLLILAMILYFGFYTFEIFDVVRINKAVLTLEKCKIYADYLPGNATAQTVLQIRTVCGTNEIILQNKELYSSVSSMQMLNDSLLEVVLEDSTFSFARAIDTIALPSCCR